MNTFGRYYRLTTFGESHGPAIGGIIDGVVPGIKIELQEIQNELNRRKPGKTLTSPRKEPDKVELLSGLSPDGFTLGSPIGFIIRNTDTRPYDYSEILRPNHADYTYLKKYGRLVTGGGRSSARETACRVVGGAIAAQIIANTGIKIYAWLNQVGEVSCPEYLTPENENDIYKSPVFCPSESYSEQIMSEIRKASDRGDSIGGLVKCIIKGLPIGLGEPIYDKFQVGLASAMLSINAVKGFEYGSGFSSASKLGSEMADLFTLDAQGNISFNSNYSGGIQGGLTNGEDIYFSVAFKPTPSISCIDSNINTKGEILRDRIKGRHDPCVAVRGVPVVKAMATMVVLDYLMGLRLNSLQ